MYPQGVCRIRKPAYAGNGCAIFPTFSDEEWTEKIRPQPQTIYSVLPNGGGFSAAPLEPASYQFSCRDKKIAPGEYIQLHEMRHLWNKAAKPIPVLEKS